MFLYNSFVGSSTSLASKKSDVHAAIDGFIFIPAVNPSVLRFKSNVQHVPLKGYKRC